MSFSSLGLHGDLLRGVDDLGFTEPTPIQNDTIPEILAGRDVLAAAKTGSGKTAAFLLPILHQLLDKPRGTTRVLVLTPTRELAAQIAEHLEALARHTDLKGAAVFGGLAMGPQEEAFRAGVDVLVATPGRLLDHFQNDYARLDGLEVLVVDEADRMLDMGFLPDVRRVLAALPPRRQTLLLSATLPPPIVELSSELLTDPVQINIERKALPAEGIEQAIYPVREELKRALLLALLGQGEIKNVLVFTRTKHRANRLAEWLKKHGISCERIHGNRSQRQRMDALAGFKSGTYQVLVATDIAARGIDVEELSHVINFDVPNVPDDYIHRVGRTARAEATGDALTFVSPQDEGNLRAIERAIGHPLNRQTLEGFDYDAVPADRFEVPVGERLAEIRSRRGDERGRATARKDRQPSPQQPQNQQPYNNQPPRTWDPRSKPANDAARPSGSGDDLDSAEEARIRAKAEQQQAAAVEARTRPSRMGIMELRNARPAAAAAGRPATRRRSRRGRLGR